jgi:hypothetical protein
MLRRVQGFIIKIKRVWAFIKIAWNNYDWDDGYLHQLVLFKLKRMQYEFIHNGYHAEECVNYKPKMKSLKLAIKLMERVVKHDYNRFLDIHYAKWGQPRYVFEPYKDGMSKMTTIIDSVKTEEDEITERNERIEAYNRDDRIEARDLRLAYAIIGKYSKYWWD